jgi:hypothetical protein
VGGPILGSEGEGSAKFGDIEIAWDVADPVRWWDLPLRLRIWWVCRRLRPEVEAARAEIELQLRSDGWTDEDLRRGWKDEDLRRGWKEP